MAHLKRTSTPRAAPPQASTPAALFAPPIVDLHSSGTAVTIDIKPMVEGGRKLAKLISRRTTALSNEAHSFLRGPVTRFVSRSASWAFLTWSSVSTRVMAKMKVAWQEHAVVSVVGVLIVGALVGRVVSDIADEAADDNGDDGADDGTPEPVVGRPTSYPLSRDPTTPSAAAAAATSLGHTPRAAASKRGGDRTPEVRFSLTPQTVSMTPQTAMAILVDDDAEALEELTARSMRERSVSETQFEVMFNERPPSPKEMIKTKLAERAAKRERRERRKKEKAQMLAHAQRLQAARGKAEAGQSPGAERR